MQRKKYDYSVLIGKIIEKLGSREKLAELMGCNSATLSRKLHNKSQFNQNEISTICEILNEEVENIPTLFYKIKVR